MMNQVYILRDINFKKFHNAFSSVLQDTAIVVGNDGLKNTYFNLSHVCLYIRWISPMG